MGARVRVVGVLIGWDGDEGKVSGGVGESYFNRAG